MAMPGNPLSRRSFLAAAATAALAAPLLAPTRAGATTAPAPARRIPLLLPTPTGRFPVGVLPLHLRDLSRPDPVIPEITFRDFMVSVWYPANPGPGQPRADWLLPAAWRTFQERNVLPLDVLAVPRTHGRIGARVRHVATPYPVVIFSPGFGLDRDSATVLVEDLVSHGYVVVTVDHPHDAGEVQFPDGHVVVAGLPDDDVRAVGLRMADVLFTLDRLPTVNAGRNPSVAGGPLPAGLAGALDLRRVAVIGHSLGGATAAHLLNDPRVRAGANLDGGIFGPPLWEASHKPFLFFLGQGHDTTLDPTLHELWTRLHGFRAAVNLRDSGHLSFTDFQALIPQLAGPAGFTPEQVAGFIGTINPAASVRTARAYLRSFLDLTLRHHDDGLLHRPSPRFPDARLVTL
ncbi:Platelet-activating factor acetylhydrolase, isoform II [Asanoa ishikariensis]|uniref:Platelet-activating factor acetylhydrolase, isoform II n=1 Tax=Asanoa ishikariensis TaxID=137265 RepID=A0A1H3UAC0_9ACTN|nr:hydrolase [Asanoa ishikariensis]SDZ59346.1 Platelet-activating factor acetylhydrolase, isoform II [Asanoa ishikariensis]